MYFESVRLSQYISLQRKHQRTKLCTQKSSNIKNKNEVLARNLVGSDRDSEITPMQVSSKISFNINSLIFLQKGKVGSPDKSKEVFDIIEHPDNASFGAMSKYYFKIKYI